MTLMYRDALRIAEVAKSNNSLVVFGGPHTTVMPETLINNQNVDILCLGEGEVTFSEVINAYEKGIGYKGIQGIWYKEDANIIKNSLREPLENLDLLPYPARDLLDLETYMNKWFQLDSVSPTLRGTNIIASRGCPYKCSFCQPTLNKIFGIKLRKRSPSNIVGELEHLTKNHHINSFMFQDDTFTIDQQWASQVCDEIINRRLKLVWGCNIRADRAEPGILRKMQEAGCRKVFVGAESSSNRILNEIYQKMITPVEVKNVVKTAKSLGVHVQLYFMLGAPTETRREIYRTIRFAASLPADEATFSITTPLPATHLYDLASRRGWIPSSNFSQYDYYKCKMSSGVDMRRWEIELYRRLAFLYFYLHPKRWNFLRKIASSRQGLQKLFLKLKRI